MFHYQSEKVFRYKETNTYIIKQYLGNVVVFDTKMIRVDKVYVLHYDRADDSVLIICDGDSHMTRITIPNTDLEMFEWLWEHLIPESKKSTSSEEQTSSSTHQ